VGATTGAKYNGGGGDNWS